MTRSTNFRTAITMKGFSYLIYNGENIENIRNLCTPYEVRETKRYKSSRRISIEFPNGNSAVEVNNTILKINDTKFLVLTEDEFNQSFLDT